MLEVSFLMKNRPGEQFLLRIRIQRLFLLRIRSITSQIRGKFDSGEMFSFSGARAGKMSGAIFSWKVEPDQTLGFRFGLSAQFCFGFVPSHPKSTENLILAKLMDFLPLGTVESASHPSVLG